jgi:hypothetical protein
MDRPVTRCRSCASKGRTNARKGKGIKNTPEMQGAYNSYHKARRRVRTNHNGAYTNIEFRFTSFDEWWNELGERPEDRSVDRINNDGHYEPGNVRWATRTEQSNNRGKHGRHQGEMVEGGVGGQCD